MTLRAIHDFCTLAWVLCTTRDGRAYLFANNYDGRWQAVWCRLRNHPNGVVWYNAGGLDPDMTCKDCGDDLG